MVLPLGELSAFLTIFRKIHQNSAFAQGIVSTHFNLKIQFQVVWGAPNPNFALQLEENGSILGEHFVVCQAPPV